MEWSQCGHDTIVQFEVGGRSKGYKQIAGIENSFVVQDDVEFGLENKIPLWLFGLLY